MEYTEVTLKFQRVAMADLISTSILSSSQKKKRKKEKKKKDTSIPSL